MMLPISGHPSTELEAPKKRPNKSCPSNLTPLHRALIFTVIFFQVSIVLYLTRTHHLSLPESHQVSPVFQARESRIVSKISSKTYGSLPNKGISNILSKTYSSLPNKGVPNVSSATQGNLPNKRHGSLLNKGVSNISSKTHRSLPKKGVSNVSSKTHGSLPNEGVSNISSETYASLPNKGVLNIALETYGSLPNKGCDSGRIYVYDLPPMFNYDLMNNCNQLEPPDNECDRNLNDGLGPAAREFAGMLPESIIPAFYWTDMYWGEVVFHNRMLNHKCRTLEPESATAFYIPFYAALDVRKHLFNHTVRERDMLPEMLTDWVQEQKWWKRSIGSNHFIMLGRITWDFRREGDSDADWGNRFLHMPAMRNVIRVSVERSIWDDLEIAVPYPTIFHPRSDSDIFEWQEFVRSRRRNHLFAFVGGGRSSIKNDFRGILQKQCLDESTVCRHVNCGWKNCSDRKTAVMEAFLDSNFCLQPRGDAFTRRSVFDCMLAGSIPVFFWRRTAYMQYELFMPIEPEDYSVFIHRDDVRNRTDIRRVLERYGRKDVKKMREKVIEYIPRFVYAKPSQGLEKTRDAFDIALDGVLTKYKAHMEKGRIGNWNEI
ncbi:xyloglucan galactosyltransferase XLT2-like [Rhododendron vialii]|uniref:xyloglucan galactosyltransferase XLT2-like n=1 Tax=Rhododendron vialii TaxID=182163 RepID=UPI00265D76BA|nr:xyloglucan galactosyltransferase XLT2-like [Rhododendron vialii]